MGAQLEGQSSSPSLTCRDWTMAQGMRGLQVREGGHRREEERGEAMFLCVFHSLMQWSQP